MRVKIPRKRALGVGVSDRDGNLVLEGRSRRCQHSDQVCFPEDPGIRNPKRRAPEVSQRHAGVSSERPEGIVYLHLRDGGHVRPVVEYLGDDESRLQSDALKIEAFDRRVAISSQAVGWSPHRDDPEERTEKDKRQQRQQKAAYHVRGASARNNPIHPSSANSL